MWENTWVKITTKTLVRLLSCWGKMRPVYYCCRKVCGFPIHSSTGNIQWRLEESQHLEAVLSAASSTWCSWDNMGRRDWTYNLSSTRSSTSNLMYCLKMHWIKPVTSPLLDEWFFFKFSLGTTLLCRIATGLDFWTSCWAAAAMYPQTQGRDPKICFERLSIIYQKKAYLL